MDDLGVPNLRSRSRSKTPFQNIEFGPSAVKKVPTVGTVEEEPNTPANVRSSARTTRKTITSSVIETSTSSSSVRTVKSGATQSSPPKASGNTPTNGNASGEPNASSTNISSKEINQNELNSMFEENSRMRLRTSTPIQATAAAAGAAAAAAAIVAGSARRPIVAAALNVDVNEHVAYREYRDAGEYWNKYPKTDYTYSRLSPHRRELAPGVVAMPNMSRRSLEHHHERVQEMAKNAAPGNESFIRRRYQSSKYKSTEQRRLDYDSQDEADETGRPVAAWWRVSEWRLVSWCLTIVTTVWTSCTSVFRRRQQQSREYSNYYTQQLNREQQQGWFRKSAAAVSTAFLNVFRCLYVAISSVLFLDTWLLRSSTTASNPNKKRFLLLLLILLPLLLLAAWHLHTDTEREAFVAPLSSSLQRIATATGGSGAALSLFSSLPTLLLPALDLSGIFDISFDRFLLPAAWSFATSSSSAPGDAAAAPRQHGTAAAAGTAAMSEEQYRNLLAHLNAYVRTYVHEHIAANVAVAADKSSADAAPQSLSEQNIAIIAAMITERLNNNLPSTTPKPDAAAAAAAAAPSIERIVAQVLQSSQFAHLRDANAKLSGAAAANELVLDGQHKSIGALQRQVEQIFTKLAANEVAQQNVDTSLRLLLADRDAIDAEFRAFRASNDERLVAMQLELNVRFEQADRAQFAAIDDRIKLVLMDAFGYRTADGTAPGQAALKQWLHSVFVAKRELEERLLALAAGQDRHVREEIERSAGVLMQQISERIRTETIVVLEQRQRAAESATHSDSGSNTRNGSVALADEDAVRRIVADALRVYDADKTGRVDYALESAGGEIVSTRCTETYHTKSAQISIFGIPLWYPTNTPRTAISPAVQPGQCWAFQGFPGFLVLKLNAYIYVTGFTMEHIARSVSPNGNIDSAPKTFTVWGLEHADDHDPLQFGTYEFHENGTNLQYFRVDEALRQRMHNIVELRIESNHGNANYTCLYRFRVHGTTGGS